MSDLATTYAWDCSEVKGGTKLVLLAIASRVRTGYIDSGPMSLAELQQLTGLKDKQVRRCRDQLIRLGVIERVGDGRATAYRLSKMQGKRLPITARENPELFIGVPGRHQPKMPDKMTDCEPLNLDILTAQTRTFCPTARAWDVSPSSVRTVPSTTTTTERAAVSKNQTVHEFLDWWTTVHPLYSDGVPAVVDRKADAAIVHELLKTRTLARVKAMAIVMLLVTPAEDWWIAASDRSLRVLRHKQLWLERRAADLPKWWHACAHLPKCVNARACLEAGEKIQA